MIDTFYFIGFGSIAKSLIEIWQLEKLYFKHKIVIIEPLDIPDWCFKKHKKMKHIQKAITKKNHKKLLKKIGENTMVIDLSVNVDCLMIIGLCNEKGACYVNTSLENWENYKSNKNVDSGKYKDIKDDTLYHRKILLDEKNDNADHTILTDIGFNPGFVNVMALCAIDMMHKGYSNYLSTNNLNDKDLEYNTKDENFYSDFCKDSNLVSIQIVELDTQKTDIPPSIDTMFNTWSCEGWQSECVDNVMMGYNPNDPDFKDDKYIGIDLIHPDEGDKNVVFLPVRGIDITRKSVTLDLEGNPVQFQGYMIPHGEANTLSQFLTVEEKGETNYIRPSVYYVYSPCEICIESTNYLRENKYKPLKNWHVLNLEEISEGYDSIGVLFTFENGEQLIFCSVVDTEFCKSIGFKFCNSTGLQVSASLNASIKYILNNEDEGLIEPEDLPHQWIFREAEKYLGKIYFKSILYNE